MAFSDLQTIQRNVVQVIAQMLAGQQDDSGSTEVTLTEANVKGVLSPSLDDPRLDLNVGGATLEDGTALAVFADGASATPGYHDAGGTEAGGIRWNNHATPTHIALPPFVTPKDMDVTQASTLYVLAAKVGATVGDAVTWAVTAFSVGDGSLYDADADFGGTSSAMTGDAATKTCQLESLAFAADTFAAAGVNTLTIQPTDGTLGTDDVILMGVWLEYKKKTA